MHYALHQGIYNSLIDCTKSKILMLYGMIRMDIVPIDKVERQFQKEITTLLGS